MKETNFQRLLIKSLRECGAVVFNIHGHSMQIAGIPDLWVGHKIWNGWLELKTGNNVVTKLQENTLRKLMDCGVYAVVLQERKPNILVKISDGTIIGHIPFSTNDIDGISFLNKLKDILKD